MFQDENQNQEQQEQQTEPVENVGQKVESPEGVSLEEDNSFMRFFKKYFLDRQVGEYVYAGFFRRFAALLIDNLLLTILVVLLISILSIFLRETNETIINLISVPIFAIYYIYMLGKFGQTFGKKWLKVKVIKSDGTDLDYKWATMRFVGYNVSNLLIFLPYLLYFLNERRRTLHDFIGTTIVIYQK
ncbi:RDD family protein [bacterium]